jgi:phenylacetate-coenzyme A ligase PaaK-like adenylate-forming protein
MAVYEALVLAQLDIDSLASKNGARLMTGAGRSALVAATGDHFASVTSWQHFAQSNPMASQKIFSVLDPAPKLVSQLNEFQPSFLASYPSVLRLLAAEQAAGHLAIAPSLVWSGGEYLAASACRAIESAFGCRLMNEYGASECLSIAYGCRKGWLHVNSEWVILEGVDAQGKPSAPGELSHTALVTNLANRVQPVIRYDLGDRIVISRGPCACGNPLPAIRVEGRRDATLELRGAGGAVRLPPLALSTVVEEAAGEHRFQIAQAARDRLLVRFDASGRAQRARIGRRACRALESYLLSQSLAGVRVELDPAPPRVDARSGKLHAVTIEIPQPRRAR